MRNLLITFTAFAALLFTTSCEDTTVSTPLADTHDEFQDFVGHVEDHFIKGIFDTVALSENAISAVDISTEHTCYNVVSTGTEGWLKYEVEAEDGHSEFDRMLFLDQTGITAELFNGNGEESHGHPAELDHVTLTVIQAGTAFHELSPGVYTVKLEGLNPGDTVKLVMAHGGDDHEGDSHEGHDH